MDIPNQCNIVEIGYVINNTERTFKRNEYIYYNQFFEYIKNLNCLDTYCSVYLYDNKEIDDENIPTKLLGNLYLDFDSKNNINEAREDTLRALSFLKIVYQIKPEEVKIYFSGNKGFHIVVPREIFGIQPREDLNMIFKTIAEQIKMFSTYKTVDLQIYDNKRLFRIPNTVNSSTNLYKIMITPDELFSLSIKEIKELAKQPRDLLLKEKPIYNPTAGNQYIKAIETWEKEKAEWEINKKNFRKNKTLKIIPKCIEHILENGAEEGCRNVTIACLASFYRESGKTFEETSDLIYQWNSRNANPTPVREMKSTVKSIYFSNKTYGCSTLRTVTECDKENCKLIKTKKTKKRKGKGPRAIKID